MASSQSLMATLPFENTPVLADGRLCSSMSHHVRPRPGRRRMCTRVSRYRPFSTLQFYMTLTVLLLSCCTVISAHGLNAHGENLLDSTLEKLARRGEILIDHRPAPEMPHLERRQSSGGDPFGAPSGGSTVTLTPSSKSSKAASPTESSSKSESTGSPTSTPTPTSTSTSTSSDSGSSTSTGISTDPQSTQLPVIFDSSLGNNFTAPSCPAFFQTFLANRQFQACLPFSQLLQNSNSFFQVEKSLVRTTQTLDTTCGVNFNSCVSLMGSLAKQLRSDNACGADFKLQNPNVLQAYNGFLAYQPLYQAGCLKSTTGSYCFADAITNASSPTDSYIYYLPLGINLPGGSRPTCNKCLSDTMAIFRSSAGNSSQPLSLTYVQAAQQIQLNCGPTFVNSNVVPSSAISAFSPQNSLAILTATLSLIFFNLIF